MNKFNHQIVMKRYKNNFYKKKNYKYESRHLHALNRVRDVNGRFIKS